MKKTLGVVAAAALAAAPAVAVFAADPTKSTEWTETITATVDSACAVYKATEFTQAAADITYDFGKITNGNYKNSETSGVNVGGSYAVICNDSNGWELKAVGASVKPEGRTDAVTSVAHMIASTAAKDDIATGTATSGDASNWAFRVYKAVESNDNITGTYGNYSAVPTTEQTVMKSGAAGTDKVTGAFKTGYQVYIDSEQAAATYTGKVKYTLYHPLTTAGQ